MSDINMEVANKEEKTEPSFKWLSIAAGTTFLIGLAGLLALMSHSAWAADSQGRTGFAPGTKTFSNPFGNSGSAATADSDDDDDDLDFGDETPGQTPKQGMSGATVAGQGAGKPVSMGGQPDNGINSANTTPALSVDSETGEGAKELVTDFNFPDADIMDIARTLGRLTGKNFIFDKDVKGRISLISNSPITVGDAWRAFLTALDMSGFALIPSGKYLRIARNRDARDKQLKTYTGDYSPNTDALITRIFSLKYINSDEVARTFRSFMPANSRIMAYDQTNTVIVTDTGANIAKLSKMLEILDVEGYDAGIEVIPVKWASATELAKLIDQLIPGTGGGAQPGAFNRFGARGGGFTARRTKEGGLINTIIADERTNNLIVHANSKGADQVRELVAKLDQKNPATSGGGKVHVIYLQFADAEAVATTLNNITQASTSGGFKPTGAAGTGVNPVSQALFEGSIKVSADKPTNALVVTASPSDFVTVQRVINRLDIPRDEVFVETVIMEIGIDRTNTFTANIINPTSGIGSIPTTSGNPNIFSILTNPAAASGAVLSFGAGGYTYLPSTGAPGTVGTATPIRSVMGLVNAIQNNTKSDVLATPQIIALDNTEATFESSENIPILTSTAVPNAGVAQTVTKERVALTMKITPHINKMSNFVKLDIDLKNGEIENRVLPSAVQSQAFATLDRTAKTSVVIADSDTVVIGGLIRDTISDVVSKVPLLGDIPILGWLFKSTSKEVQKANLVVFLTPHIVRQYEKVRAILDKKLKERDEFIEQNMGGEDMLRDTRDDLIRNLPDVKQIMANKPQTTVTIDTDSEQDEQQKPPEATPDNPFTGGQENKGAAAPFPPVPGAPAAPAPGAGVDAPPPPPAATP